MTFFLCFLVLFGCVSNNKKQETELAKIAMAIDSTFIIAKNDISSLQKQAEILFNDQQKYKSGLFNTRKYVYFKIGNNTVYYNPVNDSGNAVWASLIHPLTPEELDQIKVLEHLEAYFKKAVNNCSFVVQSYFLTSFSAVSCYPFFDTITFLTPKMDFTKDFQTYYEADQQHNPAHKVVWVKPYLDVSGNGFMISVIAPVYKNDTLIGTVASDLPISKLSDEFLKPSDKILLVVTDSTLVVAANKQAVDFLQIEGLEKFFYTERAAKDVSAPQNFKLTENKSQQIKDLGQLIQKGEGIYNLEFKQQKITLLCKKIPEVNWLLLQILKK